MQTNPANYFVYILGNHPHDAVKVGTTKDLQHQIKETDAAAAPGLQRLVYYEHYNVEEIAKKREHDILSSGQDSMHRLIESMNPNWLDLSDMLV